ncbi:hypothetical protein [Endothiovibrio diazotrophicus]
MRHALPSVLIGTLLLAAPPLWAATGGAATEIETTSPTDARQASGEEADGARDHREPDRHAADGQTTTTADDDGTHPGRVYLRANDF